MNRRYRFASSARPDGLVGRVMREMGSVVEVGGQGWLEQSDVVVVDCAAGPALGVEDWRRILEQGKTLGLVGMQNEDRARLQQITGRALKASIANLFLRRSATEDARHRYTIVPAIDPEVEPAKYAAFLRSRVFVGDCCSGAPVAPPPTINDLWPTSSQCGRLFATRQTLLAGVRFSANFNPAAQATLGAEGYFFRANGDGADNSFHVIIVSRISDFSPMGGAYLSSYGVGLTVTPSVKPLAVYSTQPSGTNTPPPPSGWGNLGDYIRTTFGFDPTVQIKVKGTPPGSNQQVTFPLTPTFDEYRNPFTTPGIDNFFVWRDDSDTQSSVQFSQVNTIFDGRADGGMPVTIDGGPGKLDTFIMISYFQFANPNTSSFSVGFNFNVQLFLQQFLQGIGNIWTAGQNGRSVPIDLVAATQLTPVT